MKKTIIKTVIITLASIIFAASLAVGITLAVSPKTIGKVFTKCGNYDTAAKLYESQYKKTESVSDLIELVSMSIAADNDEMIAKYGDKLTVNYKGNMILMTSDEERFDNYSKATVEAYYKLGKKEDCVRVAFLSSGAYTEGNSLYYLFRLCDNKEDKDLAEEIYKYDKKNSNAIVEGKSEMQKKVKAYKEKYGF